MTLRQLWGWGGVGWSAEDPCSQIRRSHFQAVQTVVPKTEQLCPLVSLALLNESWNWFFKRWHLDQRTRLAPRCHVCLFSSPKIGANCSIECRWTPSCPAVWGSTPLQTGCLSEALTSSALLALTGRLAFLSLLFFLPHRIITVIDLKARAAIYLAGDGEDGHRGAVCICVCVHVCAHVSYKSDTSWQRLIMFS